ncbi:MAG: PEGA domain-containing protein [Polyangiales bacterium]
MPLSARVVFAALLLASPAVTAQPRDDRALIEQGRSLRRAGRDADALAAFRQAYAIRPRPETAGQIGFAEHALGHWISAWNHLRVALAAETDPWVVAQRAALEFSLSQVERHLGSLRVESDAPGASVTVEGNDPVVLPMAAPIRVASGSVVVETRAPGHRVDRREVTVGAGETVRVVVALAPEATDARPAEVPARVEPPSGRSALAMRRPDEPLPRPVDGGASVTRVLAWVTVGGAALALGSGFAAMAVRDAAAENWNDDARCLVNGRTREQNCASERDTVSTANGLMIAGFAVGGAFAVGATVLFLASPSSSRERPVRVTFDLGPGRAGLGLSASF